MKVALCIISSILIIALGVIFRNNQIIEQNEEDISMLVEKIYILSEQLKTQEEDGLKDAAELYEKLANNIEMIDAIATDVYSVWESADYDDSPEKINKSIQKALSKHQDKIDAINNSQQEIEVCFNKAKETSISYTVKSTMEYYLAYKDAILKANAALDPYGYVTISTKKDGADRYLRDLYVAISDAGK